MRILAGLTARRPILTTRSSRHVVEDDEALSSFGYASQDFVVTNHFLEHSQDPIGTIRAFLRVLRTNRGIQEVGNPHYDVWRHEDRPPFAARPKTGVGLDVVEAYASCPEQGGGILILRKGDAGKDHYLAEASLTYARESFRQRCANHSPL